MWSDLPTYLLCVVFEKYGDDLEYLSSCAGVCCSWRAAINRFYHHLLPKTQFQLLLTDTSTSRISLYDIQNPKIHEIRISPRLQGRWIRTSCYGWLLTTDSSWPYQMNLLNPLTGERIRFPPARNQFDPRQGFYVITSGRPSSDSDFMVLGMHPLDEKLFICKPGDLTWTAINCSCSNVWFLQAIFYKDEFYVMSEPAIGHKDFMARIRRDDLDNNPTHFFLEELTLKPPLFLVPELLIGNPSRGEEFRYTRSYLVELMDDFLIVLKFKHLNSQNRSSRRFEVYSLDWKVNKEWIPVKSLGNNGIYLGIPSSMAVSIGEYNSKECRANCIYFVERQITQPRNIHILRGVYDMETQITQWSTVLIHGNGD